MNNNPHTRAAILRKICAAIAKHNFTAHELSIPPETDLIALLLAMDEFPYKLCYTKLAIIAYIGSRGFATRKELMQLLSKDYSTIAHNLIDMENYGYLHSEIYLEGRKRIRRRRYHLAPSGQRIFTNFFTFYIQKLLQTRDILNENNPPQQQET